MYYVVAQQVTRWRSVIMLRGGVGLVGSRRCSPAGFPLVLHLCRSFWSGSARKMRTHWRNKLDVQSCGFMLLSTVLPLCVVGLCGVGVTASLFSMAFVLRSLGGKSW